MKTEEEIREELKKHQEIENINKFFSTEEIINWTCHKVVIDTLKWVLEEEGNE